MNKFMLALLTVVLSIGCAAGKKKVEGPPWDSASVEDKAIYVDKYRCPEATAKMNTILTEWNVTLTEKEDALTTVVTMVDAEGTEAVLIYVGTEENPGEPTLALAIMPGEVKFIEIAMEFGIAEMLVAFEKAGGDPESLTFAEAAESSDGSSYYCYFSE